MYRLFLSLRFLRHHWLMTLIGSFFVGASLVILVVVMAVMDGFQAKLKETIAGADADLTLTPRWRSDPVRLAKAVEELCPSVEVAGPYYETITLTRRQGPIDPTQEKMHYAAVYGIDPQREQRINRFREYLFARDEKTGARTVPTVRDLDNPFDVGDELDRQSGAVGAVVGHRLREELGVVPGRDWIRVAIAETKSDGNGNDPQDVSFKYIGVKVVGVYQSGNSDIDKNCIFMDHRDFARLFNADVARGSIRCRLKRADDELQARAELVRSLDKIIERSVEPPTAYERLPAFQRKMLPESWKEKNRALVQAIESEKSMILVIAFLIVVAGTSSIFAAQWLLVSDKVREIGILRAIGADFGGVVSIFVLNGFLMGLLGSIGGAAAGLLVVHYIDSVHALISTILGRPVFDPNIYLFEHIPTRVDYAEVTRYAVAALASTLIAAAVPAVRAGLMNPAEALHRE